ncbi:AraC family transcriptional regulator [Idiomarina sp. UBA4206]|uniref:AraC family transcriptional regulator n=1 Tax=Idiomarina sp. UBA4206 TaxID=1946644 RepID=UPI002579B37C|nr:AraC family transcriptional regulator [Idiomarina sp. UBA4206]
MTKTTEHTTQTTEALNELLEQVAQGTELHFESGLCGDWTLMVKRPEKVAFHVVTKGDCWFGFPDSSVAPVKLSASDIIFVNKGVSHFLSETQIPSDINESDIPQYCQPDHQQYGVVCYDVKSAPGANDTLFQLLPPWLILKQADQYQQLSHIIEMIRFETTQQAPGYHTVISRLSDVLALNLLRQVIDQGESLNGPLAALNDRQLRSVVIAIIDEPGADWSEEHLAELAYLSVSAFAERCIKKTGLTPKKLVDQLRLQRARMLLNGSQLPLDLIAEQLGYQSATAFSRFFKKYAGLSPADYRQNYHP